MTFRICSVELSGIQRLSNNIVPHTVHSCGGSFASQVKGDRNGKEAWAFFCTVEGARGLGVGWNRTKATRHSGAFESREQLWVVKIRDGISIASYMKFCSAMEGG